MDVEFQFFARSPVDILRLILQYATMEEICALDTAMTNHSSRFLFLQSLNGLKIVDLNRIARGPNSIRWLLNRHIAVTNLIIPPFQSHNYEEDCAALIIQNKSSLQSIKLSYCHFSEYFFLNLKSCHNVTSINLENSSNLYDACILNALDPKMPLLSLDISKCPLISPDAITFISETCHKLENFTTTNNSFFNDAEVSKIIQGCPNIRLMGMSGTRITDVSLATLLSAYPNIEEIDVESCRHVTTAGKLSIMRAIIHRQLLSHDPKTQLIGARSIRRVLSDAQQPSIDEVVNLGVVPTLIKYLACDDNPGLQYEATWALTNIASGTTDHTQTVVSGGAIPQFVRLLSSPVPDVFEQATWALGNIAGDSIAYRDLVLSSGALQILAAVDAEKPSILRNVTWTISNLCRGKPPPPLESLLISFPFLLKQLYTADEEVKLDACYAVSYISDGENERIQRVLDAGFLPPVVDILKSCSSSPAVSAALRVVGNILTGDESQTQAVLDFGILPIFGTLLNHPKNRIKKEVCWSISNITAGNVSQIQAVIDSQLFPKIQSIAMTCPPDVSRECLWCVGNATEQKNPEQIDYLLKNGLMSFLAWGLDCSDSQSTSVVLSAIMNILLTSEKYHEPVVQEVGFRLQDLSAHYSPDVVSAVDQIVAILKFPLPSPSSSPIPSSSRSNRQSRSRLHGLDAAAVAADPPPPVDYDVDDDDDEEDGNEEDNEHNGDEEDLDDD